MAIRTVGIALFLIIGFLLAGCLRYNVYSQKWQAVNWLNTVLKAGYYWKAKMEREDAGRGRGRRRRAQQEPTILQGSMGGPDNYLRYLQIQSIDHQQASVIYVPTEGGLPITEARRFSK
jgi:hypothetical protein